MKLIKNIITIIIILIASIIIFSLTGLAIISFIGIAIAIIILLFIFSLLKNSLKIILVLAIIGSIIYLILNYSNINLPLQNKLTCQQDSDCICGGIITKTGECFVGNKDYYDKFVNKNATCPDFCTGIAGNGQTRCINNKCQNLFNQTK